MAAKGLKKLHTRDLSMSLLGLAYLLIVTEYQLRAGRPVVAQAAERLSLSSVVDFIVLRR